MNSGVGDVFGLKYENKKIKNKLQKPYLPSESQNTSNNNSLLTKPLYSDPCDSSNSAATKPSFNAQHVSGDKS